MTGFRLRVTFAILGSLAWSSASVAAPITYNLRDPFIETIDEVNSFAVTVSGVTATLTAIPTTFNEPPVRSLLLNQTASSFGINVDGTTCGGTEESSQLDGACVNEAVRIVFDQDVYLNSLAVSLFGSADRGLVTAGATTIVIASTGSHNLGNLFLAAGNPWSLAYTAGNGFSFDSFTVTAVPEPASLILLGTGLAMAAMRARKKTQQLP